MLSVQSDDKPGILTALASAKSSADLALFTEALSAEQPAVVNAAAQAVVHYPEALELLTGALKAGKLRGDQVVPLIVGIDSDAANLAICQLLADEQASSAAKAHLERLHKAALPFLHQYFADEQAPAVGRGTRLILF